MTDYDELVNDLISDLRAGRLAEAYKHGRILVEIIEDARDGDTASRITLARLAARARM